jgi:hypothetical protein
MQLENIFEIFHRSNELFSYKANDLKKNLTSTDLNLLNYFNFNNFFSETINLNNILKRKNIAEIKKFIKNTKYLFSGTYGIGINYFIGKKN